MDFFENFIGAAAAASSILCQLVGLHICMQIVNNGGTDLVSPVPFMTFFVSGCLWVKYGLMLDNTNLILTNAVGALLQLIYIIVFYSYTVKKSHFHRLMIISLVTLFGPLFYIRYTQHDSALVIYYLGLYCCISSVCCYVAPMASLRDICLTKSAESMSFMLVVFNFVSAIIWVVYGMLLRDTFVTTPSLLGVLFGLIQLALFYAYPTARHKQSTASPVLLV